MDIVRDSNDPHSFAKPELAWVTDTHLELMVDFNQRVLTGRAILTIQRKPMIDHIILDSLGLIIYHVTNAFDRTPLHYQIIINHTCGSSIHVVLPSISGTTTDPGCKIEIVYQTNPHSFALYWLTPAQTADGRHPFLLSNNKLIYARSWFPCQDTPSVKSTYSAMIWVRKHFTVVMSALSQGIHEGPEVDTHVFRQEKPVPSYAVVIAVGSLRTKKLNENISIFAEENIFHTHVNNFHYTMIETMLQAAVVLCGPYVWGKYNICVLPPSIAHFEIECPCVTFISSTLLGADLLYIGDSLARNVSQSWAGNLVTCENYEHLWLNKSFSLFISRKIKRAMLYHEGIDVFLQREGLTNLNSLVNSLVQDPSNVNKLRCLLPNLEYLSAPDKTTKYVPYERGYFLLCYIENKLGGPTAFEPFLKFYFNNFAFKSINTAGFIRYLYQQFPNNMEELNSIDWELWFNDLLLTPIVANFSSWELECHVCVDNCISGNNRNVPAPAGERLNNVQKVMLLNRLHSFHSSLSIEKLRYINDRYFRIIRNGKIRFLWLLLCIKVRWADKVTHALNFAIEHCSPNYACPIFQHLYEWEEMRRVAIEEFVLNRERMLDKTQKKIQQILHFDLELYLQQLA